VIATLLKFAPPRWPLLLAVVFCVVLGGQWLWIRHLQHREQTLQTMLATTTKERDQALASAQRARAELERAAAARRVVEQRTQRVVSRLQDELRRVRSLGTQNECDDVRRVLDYVRSELERGGLRP